MPDPANTHANRESFRGLSLRRRGRTGLTRCDLAARLGGGRRTVQDWEAGVNDPGAERLEALTEVLIEIFRARATSSVRCKADALLDLERLSHPRVVPFLLDVLANRHEPIDLRFSAFTSLQRAGPTTESLAVVRQLSMGDAFGPSARHVLS